jgi:hypothetical protein
LKVVVQWICLLSLPRLLKLSKPTNVFLDSLLLLSAFRERWLLS